MIRFKFTLFVAFLFMGLSLQAQDPVFTQFYATPLQLNPAFAGSAFAPRVRAAYRNQWAGFNTAYRTYAVYYEQSLDKFNSGIGFAVEGDDAGDGILKNNKFYINYAYRLPLTKDLNIKFGVEGGLYQTVLNWDKLVFSDQIDANFGIINPSNENRPTGLARSLFDASAGILVEGQAFWAGYSMKHLTTPNESFSLTNQNLVKGLPIRHSFHAGTEITVKKGNKIKDATFISPNILFVSQGAFQQINVGAYGGVGSFFAGLWYRHTFENADASVLLVGFKEGVFKLGMSYDMTVSKISNVSGGTFELTLGMLFDQDKYLIKRRQKEQTSNCMKMFD